MAYTRVTKEERKLIYRWRQESTSRREIAQRLGRATSSICRELVRNLGLRGYRPKQAHEKAQAPARRPGPRRFTEEVTREICALFATLPKKSRLSLTLDKGKEFARHEKLERDISINVYFAKPCHSWERGANENTNGLIRRLYPCAPRRSSASKWRFSLIPLVGDGTLPLINRHSRRRSPRQQPALRRLLAGGI